MRQIRLTDDGWDAPREKLPRHRTRAEAEAWWREREKAQRRQRVRDACVGEDEVSGREQAWMLWLLLVEEGRMG